MPSMRITAVTQLLRRSRLPSSSEAALQIALERVLTEAGLIFEREARLSAGERIDFLVEGGIGIEAKVRYPRRAIYRQLERYAAKEQVTGLILVTGTAIGLPSAIGGKPSYYVSIGRSSL